MKLIQRLFCIPGILLSVLWFQAYASGRNQGEANHGDMSQRAKSHSHTRSAELNKNEYALIPVWQRLQLFNAADRKNAFLQIELSTNATASASAEARQIEIQWNNGHFDEALRRIQLLEESKNQSEFAVGISWKSPREVQNPTWETDVKVSNEDQITKVCLDFDADTGNLFATLKWYDNFSVNISKDGGQTWQETYQWWPASHLLPDIDGAILQGYMYVGHIAYFTHNVARVRRFRVDSGEEDLAYSFQTVFDKGIEIYDIALTANTDDANSRIYFLGILEDNSLVSYWSDASDDGDDTNDAKVWREYTPAITNAARGLDACYNQGTKGYYLFASYVDTDDKLHVIRRNQLSWNNRTFTQQLAPTNLYSGISAYRDTVAVVFEYNFPNGYPGVAAHVSANAGTDWSYKEIAAPQIGTSFLGPDVSARKNGGIGVVYIESAGAVNRCMYTHANYRTTAWSTPEAFSEMAPAAGQQLAIESITPLADTSFAHGALWIDELQGLAYFDRLDGFSAALPTWIYLTSPNGGNVWYVGNYYGISWQTDRKTGHVMVEISTTGGSSWWDVTQNQLTENDGYFVYQPVYENISGHCLFRIRLNEKPTIGDQSDLDFTIVDPSYVKRYVAAQIPSGMSEPVIDGDLSDVVWNVANPKQYLNVGGVIEDFLMPWTNFADNHVNWKALWSAEFNLLYVAVEVKDDITGVVDNDYDHLWQDDCIEFFTDADNNGGFYWTDNQGSQQWFIRRDNAKHIGLGSGAYTGTALTTAVQQGEGGNWTLEAAMVLFDNYPNDVHAMTLGNVIGWEVWYDDSDNTIQEAGKWARDHQVGWGYMGFAYFNADAYQEMELGPAPSVPVLSVSPLSLDFGTTENTLTFEIRNQGSGTLTWDVTENPNKAWITSISPASGTNDATVTVTVDRSQLTGTGDTGTLAVNSNGGNLNVSLSIARVPGDLPDHWDYTDKTGNSATVILLTSANPNIAGEPLKSGDHVGVFTSGGLCCGHATWEPGQNMPIPVWGDDDQTAEIDGFVVGGSIKYRVYRLSEGKEWTFVNVEYAEGNGTYSINALMTLSKFDVLETNAFTLALDKGWNLFSINVIPSEPNVAILMNPIVDKIKIMKNGSGQTFIPEYGINTIGNINFKEGYQINLTSTAVLPIQGQKADPATPIVLQKGWSIISYLPDKAIGIDTALVSIISNLKIAKNNDGQALIPQYGVNTIGQMQPGQGYQINLVKDDTLYYPDPGGSLRMPLNMPVSTNRNLIPRHFKSISRTGQNAVAIIPAASNPAFAAGDEIGAFTSSGLCCGAVVWDGQNSAITLWGDDTHTIEIDGFKPEQDIHFKLWKKQLDQEFQLHACIQSGDPVTYQPDGFTVISEITAITSETELADNAGTEIPGSFRLLQNYPNPFNPETTIEFQLPQPSKVNLTIYDLNGHLVFEIVQQNAQPGCHRLLWNGHNIAGKRVASGVYFCVIDIKPHDSSIQSFVDVKKMILIN
ncbi:T9SS type A sorting domain-containing protein [candidate division KSB1 bacterium]|nr:T9SS type A sorting domain-containing protein [candidate division KSB1 bacterium]